MSEDLQQTLTACSIPEPNSGCWIWLKCLHRTGGYGKIQRNGTKHYAHRLSWIVYRGPIPSGLHVLHHCDNPVCINPDHLFLGTQSDNILDKEAKGRGNHPRGERVGKARLTEAQVREILVSGLGSRALSKMYGVSQPAIINIRARRVWRHIQMAIYFLVLWNLAAPPFEAGQYQKLEQCQEAARVQVAVFQRAYGKLSWKCELRVG